MTTTPDTPSILLIDDDVELCALMTEYLSGQGYRIESAKDGRRGLARALNGAYDLVILDGMLPVLDGLEVLGQLRRRSTVPVIMLTARTAVQDRIQGLETGADDYLPKPFNPGELVARIRAVLRRAETAAGRERSEVQVGPIRISRTTHEASRDEISAVLYQREASPFDRAVDVHIGHLRKKLSGSGRDPIRTVRGVGYLFSTE
jgi:two-component system response regulator CpxR